MVTLSQAGRLLQVKTTRGDDAFLLRRLLVTEVLEQPFVIQGELVSSRPGVTVDAATMIGTAVTCSAVWQDRGLTRHFHGTISAFGPAGTQHRDLPAYRFEAVPKAWFLTRAMDCRIFQEKTVQQIVQSVVDERKVGPVRFTHMPAGQRPYCVQFNETDLDFIQRLLDESGCTYFFAHTAGSEGWTITGGAAGLPTLPGTPLVVRGEAERPDAVTGWSALSVAQPGKHKNWDFDNLKPSQLLQAEAPTQLPVPAGMTLEVYRWPGGQAVRPDAQGDTAALRMQRHEASAETWTGRSEAAELSPGHKVQVQTGVAGSAKPWLLTAVTHDAFDETRLTAEGAAGYANSFTVIPGDRAWRSPVHRPRPAIPGLQSAIVTGPKGEEIHCDPHGRIKVHFLWDHRDTKKDQTSSCYVRVAQPFGGAWGGAWFLPRIGDEVVVAFLDGDPDRPVVVGSLYNADGPPPWALPGKATRSGIRSRSTKGGKRQNANIVGFDDKKDAEQLYLQAEKDMTTLVKNQMKTTVQGNEIRDISGTSRNQADGKRTTTIKGDETLTIKQGNRAVDLKMGNDSLTLDKGNLTTELKMGNEDRTLKMGNLTIKCSLGAVTIEAMQSITLKVGASKIVVDQTGVTIEGLQVKVTGTMMTTVEGLMTTVKGSAMLKETAPIIMIG